MSEIAEGIFSILLQIGVFGFAILAIVGFFGICVRMNLILKELKEQGVQRAEEARHIVALLESLTRV